MLRNYLPSISKAVPFSRNFSSTSYRLASPSSSTPASILNQLTATAAQFKTYKPVTPGLRHLRRPIADHLYEGRPIRQLTIAQRKKGGRNNQGRITVRHRGGGHKRRLRIIDFKRDEPGPQDVIRVEFDPGRSAHIALIKHRNPKASKPLSYILATEELRAGHVVQSYRRGIPDGLVPGFEDPFWADRKGGQKKAKPVKLDSTKISEMKSIIEKAGISTEDDASIPFPEASSPDLIVADDDAASVNLSLGVLRALTVKTGNVLPLRLIPTGTFIHCVALKENGIAKLVRSAGSFGQVISHDPPQEGKTLYTQVKLQSGEIRHIPQGCVATIGKVSNPNWKDRSLGKAGRARNLGWRPSVRGVAMNAVDHPHGGGRGKSKGNQHPRSVWGWLTKGKRTRRPGPKGNTMVVKQRPRGKEKRAT